MKTFLSLLLLLAALLIPAPAHAAPCSGTSGVTVVVQYPDKHIEVGCAAGSPATGMDALRAVFDVALVPGQPAVCRINGQPSSGPCFQAPDYWAYFHARRGGHWTYSNEGAGTYHPAAGSVEGWKFRGSPSNPPSIAPPGAAPTTDPTKSPTKGPTKGPTKAATKAPTQKATPGAGDPSATPTTSTSVSAEATAARRTHPHRSPSAAAATTASATATASVQAYAEPGSQEPATPDSSGGSSWIWGVALIGLVAAAGGAVALRRRRG